MIREKNMKIILAGGGTLGSVSPLIGIWQLLKEKNNSLETLFVGSKKGPERAFVSKYQIPYKSILSGKLRRYFSLLNVIDLIKIVLAIFQSFSLLIKFKPDYIISAGSFVSVPLIWASKFFKIKVILYQSDLKVGLANKLCQKRADYIFTAFPETVDQFPKEKTETVGSVLRKEIKCVRSKIEDRRSRILILGGGTGSEFVNNLIIDSLKELAQKFKIAHVTGKEKDQRSTCPPTCPPKRKWRGKFEGRRRKIEDLNYQSFELLVDDYYKKIAEADLVISRAGLSTLMELSYLAKPTILIPLPDSAQEQNAEYFCQKNAAICLKQKDLTSEKLIEKINGLMENHSQLKNLSGNIHGIFQHQGEKTIVNEIFVYQGRG